MDNCPRASPAPGTPARVHYCTGLAVRPCVQTYNSTHCELLAQLVAAQPLGGSKCRTAGTSEPMSSFVSSFKLVLDRPASSRSVTCLLLGKVRYVLLKNRNCLLKVIFEKTFQSIYIYMGDHHLESKKCMIVTLYNSALCYLLSS